MGPGDPARHCLQRAWVDALAYWGRSRFRLRFCGSRSALATVHAGSKVQYGAASRSTCRCTGCLRATAQVGIWTYRARRWIWRYFHDAPLMLRISAGVALFAFVVSLLAGSRGATEAITWVMVASIVVAALWGRWRYGNSPRLQRWDATWAR